MDCSLKKNMNKNQCKKSVGEAVFVMILPKADNSGRKIRVENYRKYIDKINGNFGGSTIKPITLGCWEDKDRKKLQCEMGFAIETFRDFDIDPKLAKLSAKGRKRKLLQDYKLMRKLAKESAEEFGQASVPVIFDNIQDVSLNEGKWLPKISDKKVKGKIKGDLFKKNI